MLYYFTLALLVILSHIDTVIPVKQLLNASSAFAPWAVTILSFSLNAKTPNLCDSIIVKKMAVISKLYLLYYIRNPKSNN